MVFLVSFLIFHEMSFVIMEILWSWTTNSCSSLKGAQLALWTNCYFLRTEEEKTRRCLRTDLRFISGFYGRNRMWISRSSVLWRTILIHRSTGVVKDGDYYSFMVAYNKMTRKKKYEVRSQKLRWTLTSPGSV